MAAQALDPAIVCGLIVESGDKARAAAYERRWEREAAVWKAVQEAIASASRGATPATPLTQPPAWLANAVHKRLEAMATRWSHQSEFEVIRTLERLGLIALPADDTYVLAAVGALGDRFEGSRANALRNDPELLDKVVWRMFEVEGGGEVSLANIDKFTADEAGWGAAFLELTGDGTLPRARVLASCLEALNRDFSAYRAGWYARLYDALHPGVDEVARDQEKIRPLTRSTVSSNVSFAVNKLRLLSKEGRLDDRETLPALPAAATSAPKGTAIATVRLAEEIARRAPGLTTEAAAVATAALQHPHADVQRAAAGLLTKLGATDRLDAMADHLEPTVQLDVLGRRSEAADTEQDRRDVDPATPVPVIAPHELVDHVAALLEDASDPVAVEAVLAALARLDDPSVLQPLTKRAASVLRRGPREGVTRVWLRGQVARLVLAASGVDLPPRPAAAPHAVAFLLQRLWSVEDVLRRVTAPRRLLATPDSSFGWLAPSTFIDRLQALTGAPDTYDLVAALLRLHPDGRPEALSQATRLGALDGRLGDVVRYALGDRQPSAQDRRLLARRSRLDATAWWIAASRSRMPFHHDDWLASHGVRGAGRSQPIDARVDFRSQSYSWKDRHGEHHSIYWKWAVIVTSSSRDLNDDEPTAVAGGELDALARTDLEDLVAWLALIYPHDCEHFLATTIDSVVGAATSTEVSHDAVRVLDAISRHRGRLGPLSLTALAAGLTASKVDQRAHAVDAVLEQHRAGRLTADRLAAGITSVRGPATLTRLAASMRDLAASSRDTRDLVVDTLAHALPDFGVDDRGVHALLESLREELLRASRPTPQELRPWLEHFRGTSRAAKAADALLAQ